MVPMTTAIANAIPIPRDHIRSVRGEGGRGGRRKERRGRRERKRERNECENLSTVYVTQKCR